MTATKAPQVDLVKLFTAVTHELQSNQQTLNASDEYNHNHGDNMVQNFQVITRALKETKGGLPSDQLAHASQVLAQRSQSGSAQLYAQGLGQAADQLRGQSLITPENAMLLVQALMGSQTTQQAQPAPQPQAGAGMDDLLGTLLGGMAGGQAQQPAAGGDLLGSLLGGMTEQPQSQTAPQGQMGGDLLGGLLGSLMGGAPAAQSDQPQAGQSGGIDLNMLLSAGMAFFQARQQGAEPLQALVQAVMAGSQMQGSAHHAQSGQLVAQTLINTLGTMLSGRK